MGIILKKEKIGHSRILASRNTKNNDKSNCLLNKLEIITSLENNKITNNNKKKKKKILKGNIYYYYQWKTCVTDSI